MASMQRDAVCSVAPGHYVRAMARNDTDATLFWGTLAPGLFVVLWSTGFVATKAVRLSDGFVGYRNRLLEQIRTETLKTFEGGA